MKINLYILISFLTLNYACRENSNSDNITDPNLGGIYTEIKGNVSGTLTFSDSPFLVKENINVLSSDTLIIEPGVALFFEEGTKLNVEGMIVAEGTKEKPVIFTSFLSGWLGISLFNPNDTSKFKFCVIQEVYQQSGGAMRNGALEVINSSVVIENCIFRINTTRYGGGLFLSNSSAIIKNNIFRDNDAEVFGGAMFLQNSTATIINNTIYRNTCYNFGGGLVFKDPLETEIQNNIVYKNYSFSGDKKIAVVSGDSTNISEQYNFLAFDEANPMFISGDDLHLLPESPCRDSGNPAQEFNDFDGTRNDQGAYGGPGGNW